ncbi:15473_t:CDS:1 [Gigaspora rosea]|nr:15473_t:CDS:1 [Gigaspora rosea]
MPFLQHKLPPSTTSCKLVSPFISAPEEFLPIIFFERNSEESDDSSFEWYSYIWNDKVLKYKFKENDSDADDMIDEVKRQTRIKKEKVKPTIVKCCTNLARNTYLKEKDSKTDHCSYICTDVLKKEESEISDLFYYYYREENKEKIFII